MLKLEEETVQAEETAVVSFSLSCLEQVKEWLERDQKHLSKVHLQMRDTLERVEVVIESEIQTIYAH